MKKRIKYHTPAIIAATLVLLLIAFEAFISPELAVMSIIIGGIIGRIEWVLIVRHANKEEK